MNARPFTFLVAVATCLATLIALFPVRRALSKIGGLAESIVLTVFRDESLPRLGLNALWIAVAIYLHSKRPKTAVVMLIATPVIAWLAGIALSLVGR